LGDGPPSFPQDFTCPVVLGNLIQGVLFHFVYRAITFFGGAFQLLQLWNRTLPEVAVTTSDKTPQPPAYNAHRL